MRTRIRRIAKEFVPPILARRLRRRSAPPADAIRFSGNYPTWEAALRDSSGYDAPLILERTRAALAQVRDGKAAFERDSVVFAHAEYQFPLLACLLRASSENGGLDVVDFGGALGSSYFQCRTFLGSLPHLRWSVVEQPAHVECGRREFANDQLRFYDTIDACLESERPNILLLSGVVQYLTAPYTFLDDALRHGFRYVIVDRTAFMRDGTDRLTVQHVAASIYAASYPSWFLSERRFLQRFERNYELLATFPALDTPHPEGGEADFKGFFFRLRSDAAM